MRTTKTLAGLILAITCGCSAGNPVNPSGGNGGNGGSGNGGGNGGSGNGMNNGGNGGISLGGFGGGIGGGTGSCTSGPNDDFDQDGFTPAQGDCNDCDKNVNPAAIEVIAQPDAMGNTPDPADEDCNGMVDDVPQACDSGFAVGDFDPLHGAAAIELCKVANGPKDWGIVSAAYTGADGAAGGANPEQVGIFDNFGPNVAVQKGAKMLALSSGYARRPSDQNPCNQCSCGDFLTSIPPGGISQASPNCNNGMAADLYDDAALNLKLRAPSNANGFKFRFKFYSFEYPEYVCTQFNDQFVALMQPPPPNLPTNNISFDAMQQPVSINVGFFDICDPADVSQYASVCGGCKVAPNPYCPSGENELLGTGFGEDSNWGCSKAGGTVWLQTQAPITGGQEFDLRLAVFDAGDNAWDSTVLLDAFDWIANGGTVNVITEPPPPN